LSCNTVAREILRCLAGRGPAPADDVLRLIECAAADEPALALEGSRALFQVLVEGLADLFDPILCDAYAEILSQAIVRIHPEHKAEALLARYRRVRIVRPYAGEAGSVRRVYVLSRVTLGADIAVTSVILDGAKRRFPAADIRLVGGEKSWQLFAADSRIRWQPVSYGRSGTLRDRLAVWPELRAALSEPDALVIDPDSRLTQLGLLPVCPEENYYFFESRSYGGDAGQPLTELARLWMSAVFGVKDAAPFIATRAKPELPEEPFVVVNLGVGGNSSKLVPEPFEEGLYRALQSRGLFVLADLGAGADEEERVREAIRRSGAHESRLRTWRGSFAELASLIAASRLYIGYDSGGQHAAAVLGTPLVTVFAGFPSPRMFARWHPAGPGPKEIIRVEQTDPQAVLGRTLEAVDRLLGNRHPRA
jgi:ADP-heptose:LPS heptosyltransferase